MYKQKKDSSIFEQSNEIAPKKSWRTWLIGKPLATADAEHQTIGKLVGLAIFSSDALSSVAYGPQELMMVLVLAGMVALPYSLPIAVAIVTLLGILTFSYEQTIHAYPNGGGAYIVARDNLGEIPALIAGAALLTDYILTVAVSISSGVAQIVSAFPSLFDIRIELAVLMIVLITIMNLRGVKEAGLTFAIPSYIFLILMFAMVITGIVRYLTGTLGMVVDPPHLELEAVQPLTIFLILRAFSNGTASLTGVEAISNGITAFKEPRSRNAGITLLWMSGILATLLLSIVFLSIHAGVVPVEGETTISQLSRTVFGGRNVIYLVVIAFTTVILAMAANTAFNGFPRLGAIVAMDGFLPRQFAFKGSRLVYSRGIVALAAIASLLVILFQASVTNLIPLYAIGVFLSFTLSQGGMARRWWKSGKLKPGEEISERGSNLAHDKAWLFKMVINTIGAIATFFVMVTFAVTKFNDGAYIIIIVIPLLVLMFYSIHRHYSGLAKELSLEKSGSVMRSPRNRVIMPIGGVHKGTIRALRYARSLSDDVTAVHISIDPEETAKLEAKWELWGEGVRLVILSSPYRLYLEPLVQFLEKLDASRNPGEVITIVVPQFVPKHWWNNFLHARTAETMRRVLLNRRDIVITEVPYQVD